MSKIYKVIMNHVTTTGENEVILKKVKGEPFSLDSSLFVRYVKGVYHLVDIETGLELNHFNYWDALVDWYNDNKNRYYMYRNSDYYREKVKKFKELKECK